MNNHHGGHSNHGSTQPGGLLVSEHGYTLELDSTILASRRQTVTFRVIGPDGRALTGFSPTHEKELHLIAVRRDTAGFQHVHPVMDETGTWRGDLDLTPGDWRIFADFHPSGHGPMTLGIDASVAGHYEPQPLPEPVRTAQAGQYTVSLDGELIPGEPSELTFSVSRNGEPVADLQPYLAAYGHLVALRVGDLAYLHVHPVGEPGDGITAPGPEILFVATAPSAGLYRLHLDFQSEGVVRTAQFTVQATGPAHGSSEASRAAPGHDDAGSHHPHHRSSGRGGNAPEGKSTR
ncbi:hypothetical protein [Kocuria nitroreducens]|uniref:hypothetical protein n=1 Tax=Kocuria nitroreducens TaxID=3058914 RepID=UPI0036DE57F2